MGWSDLVRMRDDVSPEVFEQGVRAYTDNEDTVRHILRETERRAQAHIMSLLGSVPGRQSAPLTDRETPMDTLRTATLQRVTPGDAYFEDGQDAEDFAATMRREAQYRDYSEDEVSTDLVYAVFLERPVSVPDPSTDPVGARDALISRLVQQLDTLIEDRAEHDAALQETREGLQAVFGTPVADPLALANADGATTEAITDWFTLPGGWFGRRGSTGLDEYFSARHWEPLLDIA